MDVRPLSIPDVKLITPRRFGDQRGYFFEAYNHRAFHAAGITGDFVQDNQSHSSAIGTLRGLHCQTPPFEQAKLVRVLKGRIFDVAVDIRRGSSTFGQHVSIELTADSGAQLLVPVGFLHGFATLEPDCEVLYKVTAYYSPANDKGVIWNDPDLRVPWPLPADGPVLSDKDKHLPTLAQSNIAF